MKWDNIHSFTGEEATHDHPRKHAVLEERINTKEAEYKTDIGRLTEDMARSHLINQQPMIIS